MVELEEKKYIRIHGAREVSKRTYEETKYSPDPTCFAVPYGVRVRSAFSSKAGFIHVSIKSNSLSKIESSPCQFDPQHRQHQWHYMPSCL